MFKTLMKPKTLAATACGIAVTLAGVPATQALAAQPSPMQHQNKSASSAAEGKQIFEALYFGMGPKVPATMKQLDGTGYEALVKQAEDPRQASHLRSIATYMERHSGIDMRSFGEAMQSGDPYRVEAAVNDANTKVRATASAMSKASQGNTSSAKTASPDCITTAAISVAYAVEYGVVLNAVAAVYAIAWYKGNHWLSVAPEATSTLSKEETFARISAAYAS